MNIANEKARQSLSMVENISTQTRKSIAAGYASPLLIMWGAIWIACFLGTHFFIQWANYIWMSVCGLGAFSTFFIILRQFHNAKPTKVSTSNKISQRIFWFWTLLFAYTYMWILIMKPYSGIQVNAFICTVIMFAYVVIGLWFETPIMIGLGLLITGFTMVGVYIIAPAYYCLWMAPTAGGALLGTGLYLWLRWR